MKKATAESPESPESAERRLDGFLAAFTPEIEALTRVVLEKMRRRMPNAVEMVYDNYNALVCGFGPTEKVSYAIFSIAVYPKHLNLFFLQGVELPDPKGLLQGEGSVVRHIRIDDEKTLDRADVKAMMTLALKMAEVPMDKKATYRLMIKSVSPKQRSRRPLDETLKRKKSS
jgi:hypothetical protein